jgi:hypothetical protein
MAIHSERYHSGTETVPAEVFLPDGSRGSVPGVLVIHGSPACPHSIRPT